MNIAALREQFGEQLHPTATQKAWTDVTVEKLIKNIRERFTQEWSRLFFNPYTNNGKEGRCCKCLYHCPSIDEMKHHATCSVAERIRSTKVERLTDVP